ncbi:hypothetical protein NDU88_006764 [Pleurodeles waltl]|uniref:Collagen alpha-1(I) chain-like n=1 Tax=Pleurodeles waltl TaxID=8319 RepID=A0AAV7LQ27_PLEWA|nr:hypothetical protein NDU88_006764 [Pleurodeles waltl]
MARRLGDQMAGRAGRLTPTFVSPPGFCKPPLRGGLIVEKNGHPGHAGRLVGRAGVGWSGLKPPRLPGAPGGRKAPAQRQHPEPRVWWRQSGEDSRAAQPQRFSVLGQPCVKDQLNRSCPGCRAGRGDPGGGAEAESRPGSGRSGQGLFGGRLWAACRPSRRTPSPGQGWGEYASAGTQQARVRKPPTGAPGWGSCDRAAGESSGWAWVEGPLQTTNTQPHTVSLPLCHGARGAGSRRPRRSSPDVPGSEALNRAPVGPPRVGPSHPPACPAPMGPGPGVRRARGGLPGRPGGRQPESPRLPPRTQHPSGTGPGPRPGASLAGGAVRGRRGARERGPGAGAGSSGQEDPTLSRGRDRGAEGGRARASPAPDPPGAARRKSQAPPETEPTPTRHDPGRVNRIVVPPWAWTTPESPAVPGRQGGLGEEEPGPAREPRLHPTRAGGWASPSRLARLGAARLGTGDSRPRRADGRRAGGAETPPSLPGTLARRPGRGFRRLARLLPVLREGPAAAGLPGPRAAPGNTPLARVVGGKLPGRAPGNVLGIVEADSQEGKPDGVPGRHAARSADGRRRLPPASPAPAGGRTLRKVACDSWRWITRLARR